MRSFDGAPTLNCAKMLPTTSSCTPSLAAGPPCRTSPKLSPKPTDAIEVPSPDGSAIEEMCREGRSQRIGLLLGRRGAGRRCDPGETRPSRLPRLRALLFRSVAHQPSASQLDARA